MRSVVNNIVVGTASIIIEKKFIHKGGVVCHIEDVAVKKEYQGTGVGRALINHIENYAKKKGAYKLILDCSEKNKGFYEKCGFNFWQLAMRKDI